MSMRWIALLGIAFVAGITLKNIEGLSGYRERLSYALGMHNWNRLQNQSVEVDPSAYISGFLDARSGSDALLSAAEVRAILGDIPDEPDAGGDGLQAGAKLQNLQRGEQPLLARQDVDGFTALESGLRYRILETGAGDRPTLEDMVVVQYRGTRLDGTELDSTYRRGKPVIFAVRQLIPGLREALQCMRQDPGAAGCAPRSRPW